MKCQVNFVDSQHTAMSNVPAGPQEPPPPYESDLLHYNVNNAEDDDSKFCGKKMISIKRFVYSLWLEYRQEVNTA